MYRTCSELCKTFLNMLLSAWWHKSSKLGNTGSKNHAGCCSAESCKAFTCLFINSLSHMTIQTAPAGYTSVDHDNCRDHDPLAESI